MATERQLEANRKNALKSTGPVTEQGKAISRRNSVVHGLSGLGLILPEYQEEEVVDRAAMLHSSLKPWNEFEVWLTECIARDQVRIENCAKQQMMRRCELAFRAQEVWDDDRRAEAVLLVDDLPRKPTATSQKLQQSPHGCALLIEYWTALADAGPWDETQRAFALDLLGVPRALRKTRTALDAPPGVDPAEHQRAAARGEINRLSARAEGAVAHFDAQRQFEATIGLVDEDPRLRLLRRYEAECARRIARWRQMFGQSRPGESYVKARRKDSMTEAEAIQDEESFRQTRAALRSRLGPLGDAVQVPIAEAVPEPRTVTLNQPLPEVVLETGEAPAPEDVTDAADSS